MAISSVKFTIDADNSKAIAGIKQTGTAVKDVGKQIQEAFGQKIKQILSFTAVEEGIRRTAEWASEISKTARALNITTDALQVLNKVASKTGTPTEAVQSMFENINKSRDEALKGNQQLILSFQKLGVTYQQLSSLSKNDLFGQTLKGVSLPGSKDQMLRAATQEVTGTPENVIGGFINGIDKDIKDKPDWNKTSEGEDIVPAEDIATISALWDQIKTGFIEIAGDFIPIVKIIMVFAKLLVDGFGMVTGLFKDAVDIILNLITGQWGKLGDSFKNIGGMLMNIGIGFLKAIADIIDWATGIIAKIWGGKGTKYAKEIEEGAKAWNEENGISKKTAKRGQAGGEIALIVATAGEGGIAKAGSMLGKGAGEVASIAGKFGAKGTAEYAGKIGGMGEKTAAFMKGRIDESRYLVNPQKLDYIIKQSMKDLGITKGKGGLYNKEGKLLKEGDYEIKALENMSTERGVPREAELQRQFKIQRQLIKAGKGIIGANILGMTSTILTEQEKQNYMPGGNASPILPMKGLSVPGDSSGGSAMLKMGGMFGAGDSKIVKLNIEMVKLLTMIQTNTSPYSKPSTVGYGNSGIGNTGNMAGGY